MLVSLLQSLVPNQLRYSAHLALDKFVGPRIRHVVEESTLLKVEPKGEIIRICFCTSADNNELRVLIPPLGRQVDKSNLATEVNFDCFHCHVLFSVFVKTVRDPAGWNTAVYKDLSIPDSEHNRL